MINVYQNYFKFNYQLIIAHKHLNISSMASHDVLRQQLIEMGFDETIISSVLTKLGETATIDSVIEEIERAQHNITATIDNNNQTIVAPVVIDDNSAGNNNTEVSAATDATQEQPTVEVSEEELRLKQLEYEEKIKQRRREREEKEKEAERIRELSRRKDGAQVGRMKEQMQDLERKQVADQMKRDKVEAKAARDAVLRQIAADREERRQRDTQPQQQSQSSATTAPSITTTCASSSAAIEGKCRLAIRLLDGSQLVQEFDSRESLSAVRVFVITQKNYDGEINFVMPPKTPFNEEDMQKPLNVLGLCPSARVHVVDKKAEQMRALSRQNEYMESKQIKERMLVMERQRLVDEIKRDKENQKAAKDAILRLIADDREQRKQRTNIMSPPVTLPVFNATTTTSSADTKDGKTCLSIQCVDGRQIVQQFDRKQTLASVRDAVIGITHCDPSVTFAVQSLNAQFTEQDMQKTLEVLGLCPSARLLVVIPK